MVFLQQQSSCSLLQAPGISCYKEGLYFQWMAGRKLGCRWKPVGTLLVRSAGYWVESVIACWLDISGSGVVYLCDLCISHFHCSPFHAYCTLCYYLLHRLSNWISSYSENNDQSNLTKINLLPKYSSYDGGPLWWNHLHPQTTDHAILPQYYIWLCKSLTYLASLEKKLKKWCRPFHKKVTILF